jgi:carboxypeptidase Taq
MSYQALEQRYRELGHLGHAQAMLGWDEAVMMPVGGGEPRADAMATLAAMMHREVTSSQTGAWLAAAQQEQNLDVWQRANLREIVRDRRRATALPETLVRQRTRAATLCEQSWRRARGSNDWAGIKPALGELLNLTREVAARLGEANGLAPYDALIDQYQPGIGQAQIDPIFAELRDLLPPFIERVLAQRPRPLPLPGPFPQAGQEALARALMTRVGFDFEHGRLDVSHHPFCGGDPDDTRITTRYDEADFLPAMLAVLHETGHAMYEQGRPKAWRNLPVGEAAGMAVHESQSLLLEMQVCRSREFLQFAAPIIRQHVSGAAASDPAWQADNLYLASTQVQRGLIRVDADEVTYPLHVILRYELERAMLDGELEVADLPDAWNEKMIRYLGRATGDNHRDGCMQDVHWYAGLFGYFPCYTLGAVMAAQLYAAAQQRRGDIVAGVAQGDFAPLLAWLRQNVHNRGRLVEVPQLLTDATGSVLSTAAFKTHLLARYLGA